MEETSPQDRDGPAHLGAEFGWSEADVATYRAKAGAFRGLMHAMGEAGLRERVLVGLPSETRSICDKPPLSVAWMPGIHFQYVLRELHEIGGDDLVRKMGLSSMLHGPVNMMRPLIEGTLRLFGATPHAFFSRVPTIMSGQVDGMSFAYEELGSTEAAITVRFESMDNIPPRTWPYWEGVFSSTFELCKVDGRCESAPSGDPRGREAVITATWQAR